MKLYGIYGRYSREFISFRGQVLVHDDRAEMEFLFPGALIREVPPSFGPEHRLSIKFHPDLATVRWPLNRSDFR